MIFKQRFFTMLLGLLFATVLADQASALYDPGGGRFCSRDPIGCNGGSSSQYQFLNGQALNRLDPNGLRSVKDVCNIAVQDFLASTKAEWDRYCGKDKFRWPFSLKVECKYNDEDKTCKYLKSTGYLRCIDEYWHGDTDVITICLSNYGFADNEPEQTIKDNISRTLRYEFVHALGSCTFNSHCSQRRTPSTEEKEEFKKACGVKACTEIRAWSYVNCRDVRGHDFDLCVLNGASNAMGNSDKKLVDDFFEKCVIRPSKDITYPPPVVR